MHSMSHRYLMDIKKFNQSPYGFLVDIILFALITYIFHLIFRYFASDIMNIPFIITSSNWLADRVFDATIWINKNIFGLKLTVAPNNIMYFKNTYGMEVNSSCSGLKQFYQVVVLFVLFPGPWKHKLWYIPFSIFIMFLTNIFRTVSLSLIQSWNPLYFEFSHDWILRPFFYIILFGLWVIWVEKFRQKTL